MLNFFSRQRRSSSIPPPLTTTSTSFDEDPSAAAVFNSQTLELSDTDPISSAISSRRLYSAFPGRSNSIVESAAVSIGVRGTAVAIPTYSPEPYWDFRRSMEEMVAALGVGDQLDLAVLRELLLCYLSLNCKHAHKYIVTAFVDLLLALSSTAGNCDTDE